MIGENVATSRASEWIGTTRDPKFNYRNESPALWVFHRRSSTAPIGSLDAVSPRRKSATTVATVRAVM